MKKMKLFGLTPDQTLDRIRSSGKTVTVPTLGQSLLIGSLGFCAVSLLVFATWSYGERWMFQQFGRYGAFFVWILLFMLTSGIVLSPLIIGPGRLLRFYLFFNVAFFCYGAAWTVIYFALPGPLDEWIGSLVGSVIWGAFIAFSFGAREHLVKLMVIMFITHSAGYFIGTALFWKLRSEFGNLLYGAIYGIGVGLGLGYCLYLAQSAVRGRLDTLTQGQTQPESVIL